MISYAKSEKYIPSYLFSNGRKEENTQNPLTRYSVEQVSKQLLVYASIKTHSQPYSFSFGRKTEGEKNSNTQ